MLKLVVNREKLNSENNLKTEPVIDNEESAKNNLNLRLINESDETLTIDYELSSTSNKEHLMKSNKYLNSSCENHQLLIEEAKKININMEDKLSLLVKAAEKIVNDESITSLNLKDISTNYQQNGLTTKKVSKNPVTNQNEVSNNDNGTNSYSVFLGKNGKPTRPFKAYQKELIKQNANTDNYSNNNKNNSISNLSNSSFKQESNLNDSDSALSSSPLSSTSPSPNELHINSQQQNVIQFLTHQLIQQQQSNSSNINQQSVVINIEDILNVILNAASIVSSSSTSSTLSNSVAAALPNNMPIVQTQSNDTTDCIRFNSNSHVANNETEDLVLNNSLKSTNIDVTNIDEITKMSLLNSNDFCNQYKKRIQQAKERLLQKKQQEEYEKKNLLLKQQKQELEQQQIQLSKSNNRKRSQSALLSDESSKKRLAVNSSISSMNEHTDVDLTTTLLTKALENNTNQDLIKLILLNSLNNQNLSESDHIKQQLIIKSLNLKDKQNNVANTDIITNNPSGNNNQICSNELDYSNESLLNYPPKKRHRIQQQKQEQQLIQQQMLTANGADISKSPSSILNDESSSGGTDEYNNQHRVLNETKMNVLAESNIELNMHKMNSINNSNTKKDNSEPCLNDNNIENLAENDIDLQKQKSLEIYISTSKNSIKNSSPLISPLIPVESSTCNGLALSNKLDKLCTNQIQSSISLNGNNITRPSRDLSSNSNSTSSSRSSSTNNNTQITLNAKKQIKTNNYISSNPRKIMRNESIDIDQMPEGPDKDEAYRERRRKNNEAAKRSRDARRAKEDDIALRAAILERENLQLKVEVAQLKQETNKLRCLLYNS